VPRRLQAQRLFRWVNAVLCPDRHELASHPADCEDYICNVCDEDIEEGEAVWACRLCDFDVCSHCAEKAKLQAWDGLPMWYRISCESGMKTKAGGLWDDGLHPPLLVHALDFSDLDGCRSLMVSLEAHGIPAVLDLIVATTVTYSVEGVDLLISQLKRIHNEMPHGVGPLRALVLHEPRGADVLDALVTALEESGWSHQRLGTEELPVEGAAKMVIFDILLHAAAQ